MNRYNVNPVVFLFFIVLFLASCKKEKNRICELYNGAVGYSVGTIDKFVSTPFKVTYIYSFEVNGNSYEGKEKAYGIGQKNERLVGKQFVVVYAIDNPSNCDLNKDFLIESDSDFQNFISNYATRPPNPDFPKNCN